MESKETVYFDEESEVAREAVKEVLDLFNGLLEELSEKGKGVAQNAMGLKIEQLKAEQSSRPKHTSYAFSFLEKSLSPKKLK
ncbi:hypothetical protein IFM89_029601 [Coptis chinensis]|uniref:Uncharacterized protein n=1 Tax=Coptis chinensis TaxID=261450 RepID=A0A835IH54_9MAGN|nr:hypothetical protein IFM89_029601 [Coptis chinensis]